MKPKTITKLYIVVQSSTGWVVSFGTKGAWLTSSAAKNAVLCHAFSYESQPKSFEDQNEYYVEEMQVFEYYIEEMNV